MAYFLESIKKILNTKEIIERLSFTLFALLLYRLGSFIVLPGIDLVLVEAEKTSASGLLGLLDVFVGGAFSNISVLALGIMPYISASIVVQLLSAVLPQLQKMRQEGESGTRKIAKWTRYLALAIALVQAVSYLNTYANAYMSKASFLNFSLACTTLMAGAMFVVWLSDRITEKGLGNGSSVIMLAGILSRFPQAFTMNLLQRSTALPLFVLEIFAFLIVILLAVLLSVAVRKIPILFAKKLSSTNLQQIKTGEIGATDYIPFKLNFSGVMPIIFAQTVLVLPVYFLSKFETNHLTAFTDPFSWQYNLSMIVLIFVFSYLYSALVFNSNTLAEDLKRNSVFVPGYKPGTETAKYIDFVVYHLILPGALFLSLQCVTPVIARKMGVAQEFAFFFGGTSLLIVVSVALDLLSQLQSMTLQVRYDKFLKK